MMIFVRFSTIAGEMRKGKADPRHTSALGDMSLAAFVGCRPPCHALTTSWDPAVWKRLRSEFLLAWDAIRHLKFIQSKRENGTRLFFSLLLHFMSQQSIRSKFICASDNRILSCLVIKFSSNWLRKLSHQDDGWKKDLIRMKFLAINSLEEFSHRLKGWVEVLLHKT